MPSLETPLGNICRYLCIAAPGIVDYKRVLSVLSHSISSGGLLTHSVGGVNECIPSLLTLCVRGVGGGGGG